MTTLESRSAEAAQEDGAVPASWATETPTIYFVDGYHGGIKGHMPAGAWRDILTVLRALPEWKISLEIEPASWTALKREDPAAYAELKAHLRDATAEARVEMLSVTFAQPYGWAVGGESNIRQLQRGLELTRAHFPEAVFKTYAVQEPCWASCLPQILRSLSFEQAVLKNPGTAWGGYSAGRDAETVFWVGPDGSRILAAPRYACEELVQAWETESLHATPEFGRKCARNGIAHPVGMCLQDLGWHVSPRVYGAHIQYVTWREYFDRIASAPEQDWAFGIEDILVALPWGDRTIQRVAQQVRSAETRLLTAEKIGALAWLAARRPPRAAAMTAAWDDLMWAEHHDAWITATSRRDRAAWAFLVASWTLNAECAAQAEIDAAADALLGSGCASGSPRSGQSIRLINTLGQARTDPVEVTVPVNRATHDIHVFDDQGNRIASQILPQRYYHPLSVETPFDQERRLPAGFAEDSFNTVTLLFRATVPAMGYTTYRIEPVTEKPEPVSPAARVEADGSVVLENDFYRLRIDPKHGGAITSLLLKEAQAEMIDGTAERLFNEYRGYFIDRNAWCSSADSAAKVSITESGPVRTAVRVEGTVGDATFRTDISLVEGQPWIDFQTRLSYERDTRIGDPWEMTPEDRLTERRKSQHDGRWKLQAHFPTRGENQAIYKNAAYDVCRSRHEDTFFQRWDEIKHNILLDWVDAVDECEGLGLAVFSDHTTAYTHGAGHPLALVLAWGAEGGFWWGKQPLRDVQEIRYAVVPHTGRWDKDQIATRNGRWKEPLLARLLGDAAPRKPGSASFLETEAGIPIPTLLVEDGRLLVRLFNEEGSDSQHTVSFGISPSRVELVELDGRVVEDLPLTEGPGGRAQVSLALPRFGIRTLRCTFDAA